MTALVDAWPPPGLVEDEELSEPDYSIVAGQWQLLVRPPDDIIVRFSAR
jgi:hypothetical protein